MSDQPKRGWKWGSRNVFVTWRRFGEPELIVWRRDRYRAEHGIVLWPLRVLDRG